MNSEIKDTQTKSFIDCALSSIREIFPSVMKAVHANERPTTTKEDGSLVTDTDRLVEAHLTRIFTTSFPDLPVLSEESPLGSGIGHGEACGLYSQIFRAKRQIIIDPIDGTSNFAHGRHEFCIVAALTEKVGDGIWPIAGVVAVPNEDAIYWCDDLNVYVGKISAANARPRVVEAQSRYRELISVNSKDRVWLNEKKLTLQSGWVSSGSSVYDFMQTSLGSLKASIVGSQRIWDIMAPLALSLRLGLVLRDVESMEVVTTIALKDLSSDIQNRPWGLNRRMVLSSPELTSSEIVTK